MFINTTNLEVNPKPWAMVSIITRIGKRYFMGGFINPFGYPDAAPLRSWFLSFGIHPLHVGNGGIKILAFWYVQFSILGFQIGWEI